MAENFRFILNLSHLLINIFDSKPRKLEKVQKFLQLSRPFQKVFLPRRRKDNNEEAAHEEPITNASVRTFTTHLPRP